MIQEQGGSSWMHKEFGVMHEEVSSSFMKQAQQYQSLHGKVGSVKEEAEVLSKQNSDKEDRTPLSASSGPPPYSGMCLGAWQASASSRRCSVARTTR